MSIFARSYHAETSKSAMSQQVALLYAGLLVIMALGQLFTFETFLVLVPSFNLPFGGVLVYLIAPLLVVSEVLAVPFLLRMRLSLAFRWFSMLLGWLAAALWIFITVWLAMTVPPVATVGFLGTVGDLTPGWWAVFVSISFGILAAWAGWGLWPSTRPSSRSKK